MRSELDYKFVEGYSLDRQQVESIENDSQNTLVVAGAGTGKTTTIIGKIKWILNRWIRGRCNIPRILVISFTHATRIELEKRILAEILSNDEIFKIYHPGVFLMVETFHSLALKIVKETRQTMRAGPDKIRLTKLGFGDFLKQTRPDISEDTTEIYERLYYLTRNYHIEYQDLRQFTNIKYPNFWQKKKRLENLDTIRRLEELSHKYKTTLSSAGEVDFVGFLEEAINNTLGAINANNLKLLQEFCFDFVIIDEYQDISPLEYSLIKKLRQIHGFRLFCVGDDWQTIYQFAGSEIDLILDFKKYWGETKVFKIEQTYRFPERLAKLSGDFVMKNRSQLVKNIRGINCLDPDQIIEINGPSERTDLNALFFFFLNLPRNARIFLIGRYNFDIKRILHCEFLEFKISTSELKISMPKRPDLDIRFYSAHKSKGLQADYVFIINCRDATLGFPSQVEEKDLITITKETFLWKEHNKKLGGLERGSLLIRAWNSLTTTRECEFAEERRLFYVAMTRARKKVFFLTVQNKESPFILELREEDNFKSYLID
ncbi:UvrD-helicase domain-containing protein [Candidatus Nanosyncoccus nanoralicus]|uniref:DNA 3'-5' helicase n=1 Tax=Candidatus Nanosyncoccus nanoralicus TaxID=2171996 RepID=A0ABY0FJD8_9BACT|nr:UvrD-helicase domain-containing protein [Candidatus Nanosyncoccus nanoralicus]RYC73115.1 DNA helicase IV [Candidatus Nanosyncoccus nanoralicus]